MTVVDLRVRDFRNIDEARLEPAADLNLILGPNASGKTSMLEALYVLGRGRSFRSADLRELIRRGAPAMQVVATVAGAGGRRSVLGLQRSPGALLARVAGQPARSLAELAAELPVLLLDAGSHQLIEGGPSQRRRFLDWGVFQTIGGYLESWRRFARALRNRNAALRQGAANALVQAWDVELATTAEAVDGARRSYLQALAEPLAAVGSALLEDTRISLDYRRGWPEGAALGAQLAAALAQDRRQGHTRLGPQRAELKVLVDGRRAVEQVSRGQQKLLAAALVIAQAVVYQSRRGGVCVLLVDDFPAELDRSNAERLLQALVASGAQLFVTTIELGELGESILAQPGKTFRMGAGSLRKVL